MGKKWFDRQPPTVAKGNDIIGMYDTPIHTDREIRTNRLDIVVKGPNHESDDTYGLGRLVYEEHISYR